MPVSWFTLCHFLVVTGEKNPFCASFSLFFYLFGLLKSEFKQNRLLVWKFNKLSYKDKLKISNFLRWLFNNSALNFTVLYSFVCYSHICKCDMKWNEHIVILYVFIIMYSMPLLRHRSRWCHTCHIDHESCFCCCCLCRRSGHSEEEELHLKGRSELQIKDPLQGKMNRCSHRGITYNKMGGMNRTDDGYLLEEGRDCAE